MRRDSGSPLPNGVQHADLSNTETQRHGGLQNELEWYVLRIIGYHISQMLQSLFKGPC